MKLTDSSKIVVKQPRVPIMIQSCTGQATAARGLAELWLNLVGKNGNTIWFQHKVIISDDIDFDLILGRDITGSPVKIAETNDFIYFSDRRERVTNLLEYLETHRQSICDVPIHNRSLHSFEVTTKEEVTIPPFALVNVCCAISKKGKPIPPKVGNGAVFYEVIAINSSELQTLRDTLLAYTDPEALSIPIYNDSYNTRIIEAGIQIAQIEHFDHAHEIHEVQIQSLNRVFYQVNSLTPDFITKDEYMNEEEKTAAFIDFAEKGYFQPSMSQLIEEAPAITEFELKDTTPYPESQFDDLFKIAHLPLHKQRRALRTLRKYKGAFSKHDQDIGKVNCIEMDIQIDETKPRIQKYVPIPHAARDQLRKILDQMEEFGVIRECNEPSLFCSNLLVIPKKDKTQLRVLLDGRLLNNATIRQPTNLVNSQEIKMFLADKDYITTVDVSHAFYQIPLSERSQPYTAFYSEAHGKRYCFMRAPQGLKNSPLHLKLVMDTLFGNMMDRVLHYADDIMIATKGSFEQHMDAVGEVLAKMETANLKINPKKVNLALENVEFLGIIWQKGKLHIPEAKLNTFKTFPTPTTPKRTKSFVCAMSYYRQFIPRFAELSKPLMDLALLHPRQFKWLDIHEEAFRAMIKAIIKNSSLYIPKPHEEFFVQTDASNVCGAGRIFQKGPNGEEMLIACTSRTFTRAERKYGAFKKEVLALLYTMRSMDYFLRLAPKLTLLVDAKAIVFLRLCKDSSGILLRFSLELSKYEAEVHHVSGKNNFISDILSRHHTDIDDILHDNKHTRYLSEQQSEQILNRLSCPEGRVFTKEELRYMLDADSLKDPNASKPKRSTAKDGKRLMPNMPQTLHDRKIKMPRESFRRPGVLLPTCSCTPLQEEECEHPTMNYDELKAITKVLVGGKINLESFRQMQQADPFIQEMLARKKMLKMFFFIENVLYFDRKKPKPVLPSALLDLLIQTKHYTVFGLHFSSTRIRRDITSLYHVNMKDLKEKLQMMRENCLVCQFNRTNLPAQTLQRSNFRRAPQIGWAIDIIPNMPTTENGFNAIFLAVDLFTGFVQLIPIKSRKTEALIEAFQAAILRPFQVPKFIRGDNETGIANSAEFASFFQQLNIKFEPTSTASPWSNAAERAVQSIKSGARKFIMQEKIEKNWDYYLHFFISAHNSSTSIYGFSPQELQYGTKIPRQTDLLQFWPNARTPEEYMEIIVPQANKARTDVNDASNKENERVLKYRNKNRSTKSFQIGEVVLHKQLQLATGQNMGMKPRFTGPFVIVGLDKHDSSAILENLTTGRTMKAHFSNLQLFSYHPNYTKLPHNFDEILMNNLPVKSSKEKYYPEASLSDIISEQQHIIDNLDQDIFEKVVFCPLCFTDEKDCQCDLELYDQLKSEGKENQFKPGTKKETASKKRKTYTLVCPLCKENVANEECLCDLVWFNELKEQGRQDEFQTGTRIPADLPMATNEVITNEEKSVKFNSDLNEENSLETDCYDHPENCQCAVNTSEEYGYKSTYEFNPYRNPTKSIYKRTSKYGNFIPDRIRPHKVCEETGFIINDYTLKANSIREKAVKGIIIYEIPSETKVNLIGDNFNIINYEEKLTSHVPVGDIIDEIVPDEVYHREKNPAPLIKTPSVLINQEEQAVRTDKLSRTDEETKTVQSNETQQAIETQNATFEDQNADLEEMMQLEQQNFRTDEPAPGELPEQQDSAMILDEEFESEKSDELSEKPATSKLPEPENYNLRRRKFVSYKETNDYAPRKKTKKEGEEVKNVNSLNCNTLATSQILDDKNLSQNVSLDNMTIILTDADRHYC
ncbi:MAG: reverse transcriptase domain-containing protein [Polynucleobacter sp.]